MLALVWVYRLGYQLKKLSWWLTHSPTQGIRCLVIYRGRILLVRNTYKPLWDFPGGGIKWREPLHLASARELAEETGLKLDPRRLKYLGHYLVHEDFRTDTVFCYLGRVTSAQLKLDPLEIQAGGWFSPRRLPQPCSKGVKHALRLAKSALR